MNEELKTMFGNGINIGTTENPVLIPVAHLRYKGNSKTFVKWTITREYPSICGDDADYYSTVSVDVDVYSNGNYLELVNAIKTLFRNNCWVWVEDSVEMYEEDTELYHKTISFEKERYL